MCGIHRCAICNEMKEMCGKACHSDICQIYLPLYHAKHGTDARYSIHDPHIYMVASGTW